MTNFIGSTGNADGSDGRIAIYYSTSFSGTANNAYLRNMSEEQVDSIFLDGFESEDLSAWSSAQTDGGDLMASQSADYWGDYGLAASIIDTNAIYVQDDTPDGEGTFHARFYINPDGLNMGAADILPIFQGWDSGGSPVIKVEINKPSGSAFQVRVNVLEGSTWVPGAWQSLSGGWTAIEINYKTTHELGFTRLSINGMEAGSVNNINNPDHQLNSVRLGTVSIPSGTTSGVLYFDDYESRRYSTIGLLPDRGVEDPEAVQEAGWAERVYSYQRSQPFAVQQVTAEEGTFTYDYDANGNMTARVENGVSWTHTYDAENRLASMTDETTTWLFSYDGDGTLVGQLVTDGVTATHNAFFMGGGYEVISDGVTETVRKYYALAGQTFGMSDNGVMKYLISDHLGSTVAISDTTGTVLSETRYMPFGEPRADVGSITQTDKTFTGQRDVPDTGLMDYRARMYSAQLGRFIQPDTIVPGAGNSQAWNRYAYGLNNPVKYIDPSGHKACSNENCLTDEQISITKFRKLIKYKWNWTTGYFSAKSLRAIYDAGNVMAQYIGDILDKNGDTWIKEKLGGTKFENGGLLNQTFSYINGLGNLHQISLTGTPLNEYKSILNNPTSVAFGNTIQLAPGFSNYSESIHHIIHELGHILDNNSSYMGSIIGNGLSDIFNTSFGGKPSGLRFCNKVTVSKEFRYDYSDYSNNSTADYFAEAWADTITNSYVKNEKLPLWINALIVSYDKGVR